MTQNKTIIGPVTPVIISKGGYGPEQSGTVAKTTLRQMTENKTYQGPVGPMDREKGGYIAELGGSYAPTTLRQLTQNKTYQGPAVLSDGGKQRSRGDVNNAYVNVEKDRLTIARDGGLPTISNYNKGKTFDFTMVQLCEPIQINRTMLPNMTGQQIANIPTVQTRPGHQLPQQDYHFNSHIVANLNNNPYINNIIYKSVE